MPPGVAGHCQSITRSPRRAREGIAARLDHSSCSIAVARLRPGCGRRTMIRMADSVIQGARESSHDPTLPPAPCRERMIGSACPVHQATFTTAVRPPLVKRMGNDGVRTVAHAGRTEPIRAMGATATAAAAPSSNPPLVSSHGRKAWLGDHRPRRGSQPRTAFARVRAPASMMLRSSGADVRRTRHYVAATIGKPTFFPGGARIFVIPRPPVVKKTACRDCRAPSATDVAVALDGSRGTDRSAASTRPCPVARRCVATVMSRHLRTPETLG